MIDKEEKKAIDLLKVLKLSFKNSKPYKVTYTLANGNEYTGTEIENIFETILNIIKKLQQETTDLQEINQEHQKQIAEVIQENNDLKSKLNGIVIQDLGTSKLYESNELREQIDEAKRRKWNDITVPVNIMDRLVK